MRHGQRLPIVERALLREPWTEELVERLMRETKASRATIYRDRAALLGRLADEELSGLAERRTMLLLELRRTREEARAAKKYSATARMIGMEAQLLGLDHAPLPVTEAEDDAPGASLEAVLLETRRLRRQAVRRNSYVAAEKFLAREAELTKAIEARDQAAREREMAHLDDGQMMDALVENLHRLPEALQARLRAALGQTV